MAQPICVDASLALKLVLDEADSDKAQALWAGWITEERDIVAPCHLMFEATSVIRNHVFRKQLSAQAGRRAFDALLIQDIALIHPVGLETRAWELAEAFNRPTVYDAFYLALAEMLDGELWTADHRLYHAVQGALPWVKSLQNG